MLLFLQKTVPKADSWFQNALLSESDSSLAWTVLHVYRCQYRPAQLNIAHMTRQLEEAEVQYITSLHWFKTLVVNKGSNQDESNN